MSENQAPLPEMSRHEASWHEHLAGMRAAEAARAQGGDPEASAAIASATAGLRRIGDHTLRPANQGTLWTLQRLAREWTKLATEIGIPPAEDPENPGTRELIELGLSTLAFCDSRQTWQALDRGELDSLVVKAEALMWETPLEIQTELQKYFTAEMDRLQQLSQKAAPDTAPKKREAAAAELVKTGPSPAAPIQPEAAASPPASGSPPNTQ